MSMSDRTVMGSDHEVPLSGDVDEITKIEVMSCQDPLVDRSRW